MHRVHRLRTIVALSPVVVVLAMWLPTPTASAGASCQRSRFETQLVRDACAKGGQSGAKKAMKDWVKEAKKNHDGLECKSCHTSLGPKYELDEDGLALFRKLGGK